MIFHDIQAREIILARLIVTTAGDISTCRFWARESASGADSWTSQRFRAVATAPGDLEVRIGQVEKAMEHSRLHGQGLRQLARRPRCQALRRNRVGPSM